MPFSKPELANAVPWSRAGQFLFLDRALANAVPQARAGQFPNPEREMAMVACWLGLFPGRKLANSNP